jgi:hypothetical protein
MVLLIFLQEQEAEEAEDVLAAHQSQAHQAVHHSLYQQA